MVILYFHFPLPWRYFRETTESGEKKNWLKAIKINVSDNLKSMIENKLNGKLQIHSCDLTLLLDFILHEFPCYLSFDGGGKVFRASSNFSVPASQFHFELQTELMCVVKMKMKIGIPILSNWNLIACLCDEKEKKENLKNLANWMELQTLKTLWNFNFTRYADLLQRGKNSFM